mgnify:FL=1
MGDYVIMMKRRLFDRGIMLFASIIGLTLCLNYAVAESDDQFIAGQHYEVLEVSVGTIDPEAPVAVEEVFSYLCIHCYSFDPAVEAWKSSQNSEVSFSRVPAVFNQAWALMAQVFYAAEGLGVGKGLHEKLFKAVHVDRLNFADEDVLEDFIVRNTDLDVESFRGVFESFSVGTKVRQADAKTRAYEVTGVPTMVVNGKYRIDGKMAGGNKEMLEVVDFLVAKERKLLLN